MERLTNKLGETNPSYGLCDKAAAKVGLFTDYDGFYAHLQATHRLGQYEDTGLTPEELSKDLAELSEYRKAKEEGRLVELPESGIDDFSDGYHTFNELYEQRAVLFSALCRLFPQNAWKSKRHADGTMFKGCFIVGINTPDGQYTYHYGIDK